MADTDLQQLVINIGTQAQIESGISGGTITSDMLSIATDTADATDINLSNVSSTGKRTACNWFLPSTSTASVTLGASGTSYTASESGYIYVTLSRSAAGWALAISVESVLLSKGTTSDNNNTNSVVTWVPVKKGQSFIINYSGQTSISCYIVKCGGVA